MGENVPQESIKATQSLASMFFSWPVLAVISAILFGFGGCFMTSPHPYVADAFCIVGTVILLVKFWTWEGVSRNTSRRTAVVLTLATFAAIIVCLGLCWLTNFMGKTSAKQVAVNPPTPRSDPNPPITKATSIPVPNPAERKAQTLKSAKKPTSQVAKPQLYSPSLEQMHIIDPLEKEFHTSSPGEHTAEEERDWINEKLKERYPSLTYRVGSVAPQPQHYALDIGPSVDATLKNVQVYGSARIQKSQGLNVEGIKVTDFPPLGVPPAEPPK